MQPDGLVISIVAPETMLHAKLVLKERLHGPARRTIAEQYEQKANISHVLNPHEQAPEITNENNMSIDPATHACVREIEANVAKGHSMFLIGPEGSGKSGAIRAAVDHLNTQRGAVGSIVYHIIRISPLIHGDDAGKMRAIRLGLQHIIDCQSPGSEGMSKLEVRREFTEELEATKQALLSFLSAPQLVSGAMVQNRLVLQLEDVHMCAPSTGRQLFLYTLLELHAMVPVGRMAIVATTVRTDAYTLLEKRVASRFPPRIVYSVSLTSPQSLISTLASHLHLPPTVQAGFLAGEDLELLLSDWADFVRIFNDAVLQSFEHERVRTELTNMYYATTNMHIYLNLLELVIAGLHSGEPYITPKDVLGAISQLMGSHDPRSEVVQSLTGPDVAIMWVFCRKEIDTNTEFYCSFDALVTYYEVYLRNSPSQALNRQHHYLRPILFAAFERLLRMKLLRPVSSLKSRSSKKVSSLYWKVAATLPMDELRSALKSNQNLPQWMSFS